jgi:hypothetical protein
MAFFISASSAEQILERLWILTIAFFIVRPAGRTHLEVKVLYGP